MSDSAKWYVIHTYSGYENAVKTSIEKFVTGRGMEDKILRMEIPMETVTEVTESGTTKEVERKVFPGYVLIKMVMTDDTWHLVRNVRGVTGFVGSANKPIPLSEEEVLAMGMEKHEIVVNYNVGDHVKIVDGPLASFTGIVEEIEPEKNRVSVMAVSYTHLDVYKRQAQDPQGLVELGDDLPLFIDVAAPDPGDAAFIRPEPAAQFGDFFFVHQKPSFVSGDIGAARRPLS